MANLRQTARKCRIAHLLNGKYVQKEGWEPSYLESETGDISRANIMGVIVGKGDRTLILDDGSGQIKLQSFEENNKLLETGIGDKVLVIGKVRAFNEQKYLNVEIIKKIDEKWLSYRKLELERIPARTAPAETVAAPKEEAVAESYNAIILEKIKELDKGEGADVDEVMKALAMENPEKAIQELLQGGEIFEVKPGRVKLL